MSDPAVKLIGCFGSPVVHRAEVALRLKGVPYELITEDLNGDRPAICESLVIVEYVNEAFDRPMLMPSDPLARATARFWASFMDKECGKSMWMALWTDGKAQAAAAREAKADLALIEGQLPKGKRFFGGDAINYLDIALSWIAYWLGVFEEISGVRLLTKEEHPGLCRWAREYTADETVRRCLPDRDRVVEALTPRKELYITIAKAMVAHE